MCACGSHKHLIFIRRLGQGPTVMYRARVIKNASTYFKKSLLFFVFTLYHTLTIAQKVNTKKQMHPRATAFAVLRGCIC